MSAFEELGLMPELIKAIEGLGWLCALSSALRQYLSEQLWFCMLSALREIL